MKLTLKKNVIPKIMVFYFYHTLKHLFPVHILDFRGPYAKGEGGGGGGGGCVGVRKNSISSMVRHAFNSFLFLARVRDFTTFTLHGLADC